MKITAGTNVLVRAVVGDDRHQSRIARQELAGAESIAIATPALCEVVWVLSQGYKIAPDKIARTIRKWIDSENILLNRPVAEAGLAMLEAGGDFADGAIASEGRFLGGAVFVSFDRLAARRLAASGHPARTLR